MNDLLVPVRNAPRPASARRLRQARDSGMGLRFLHCALMIVYFLSLRTMYLDFIQPVWEGYGFKLAPDALRTVPALILTLIATLVAPVRFSRVSDLLVVSMLVLTVVPTCVLFAYGGFSSELLLTTFAMHLTFVAAKFFNPTFTQKTGFEFDSIIRFLVGVPLVLSAYLAWRIGFSSFSLDFLNVYDRREEVGNALSFAVDGYASQLLAQLNLIASIVALHYKRMPYFVISMANAVIIFGFFGHKSQIILPALLTIVSLGLRSPKITSISLSALVAFAAFVGYYYIKTDDPTALVALTFRRLMFIPVLLNQAYFQYAQATGFIYWSDSKFGLGIIEYRDTVSVANIIGEIVTGSIKAHANTGIIGSGFVQAGFVGVGVYGAIMLGLLIIIDALARTKGLLALAALICLPPLATAVMSSDLPAMLLSGGLGLSVLILYLLPSKAQNFKTENRVSSSR